MLSSLLPPPFLSACFLHFSGNCVQLSYNTWQEALKNNKCKMMRRDVKKAQGGVNESGGAYMLEHLSHMYERREGQTLRHLFLIRNYLFKVERKILEKHAPCVDVSNASYSGADNLQSTTLLGSLSTMTTHFRLSFLAAAPQQSRRGSSSDMF